jgi:hypothetical protein
VSSGRREHAKAIEEVAERRARQNNRGAEWFRVKRVNPVVLESLHDDTVLQEGEEDFDLLSPAGRSSGAPGSSSPSPETATGAPRRDLRPP